MNKRLLQLTCLFLLLPLIAADEKLVLPGIENGRKLSDRIITGATPRTDEAFRVLQQCGVRTIVSVDAALPNVAMATKHDLRYVHVPIGYDGVPHSAMLSVVRVIRELPGKVFIHCHHGKHRGPAVAALACRIEGSASRKRAIEMMTEAGTNPDYEGLWHDVAELDLPTTKIKLPKLVTVARARPLAKKMAEMNKRYERLRDAFKTNSPFEAVSDGLLIHETFRELSRNETPPDEEYQGLLKAAETTSREIYDALKQGHRTTALSRLKVLEKSCVGCHAAYR